MKILILATIAALSLASSGAAAAGGNVITVHTVTAQTRDGGAWAAGQPVILTFEVRGSSFPDTGLAVVMQVRGERTKCLNVPLRKLSDSGATATYAGVFNPFYAAEFGGQVMFGDSTPQDFTLRVDAQLPPSVIPATEEVPAADPRETAPPSLADATSASLPAALAALALLLVPLALRRKAAAPS